MQSVEIRDLSEDFYAMARKFPEERKRLMEEVAKTMQGVVSGKIGGAGKVQSWQDTFVGTRGGYAAVRPKRDTSYQGYAVGYITNAIENGHQVRGPSGHARRYRPRLKKTRVPGKGFYAEAGGQVDEVVLQAAQRMLDRMAEELEG